MPATPSATPTPFEGSPARPGRRRDTIVWRAFAAVALPLGILYFLVSPSAETIIYHTFSLSAFVATLVGIRLYRPAPARHWWFFAAGLGLWCLGDAYWDCYRW